MPARLGRHELRLPEARPVDAGSRQIAGAGGPSANGTPPASAAGKSPVATQTLLAFQGHPADIIARKPGGEETSMKNPLESLHMTVGLGVVLTVVLIIVAQAIGS